MPAVLILQKASHILYTSVNTARYGQWTKNSCDLYGVHGIIIEKAVFVRLHDYCVEPGVCVHLHVPVCKCSSYPLIGMSQTSEGQRHSRQ